MHPRTKKLNKIMGDNKMSDASVGKLLDRSPTTVAIWRCGSDASRVIPDSLLKLLAILVQQRNEKAAGKAA